MDMSSTKQQIKAIEEEILTTQKNKATERHIGKLKAKLARLKEELEKRKKNGGRGKGFAIKKSGDATVGIIGFPNIGKSTLLNKLTGADSKIGNYDFTTLEAIPGMMKFKGTNIQVLDLPGLISGASKGKGQGREILSATRSLDLILLMVDAQHKDHLDIMQRELYNTGLRLNQKKPDVIIRRTGQGGISVHAPIKLSYLNEALVKAIASEYVINAEIIIREDITEDQLIDVFLNNRVYASAFVVINKKDLISDKDLQEKVKKIREEGWKIVTISAKTGESLEELKEKIFSELRFIRIYMKPVGNQIDYDEPLILKRGSRIEDACRKLHRDFETKFRYATVTGPSAKHVDQKVGLTHVLEDKDVLTIVISR